MLAWLSNNIATVIISLVLAVIVALIIFSLVKNKKKGKSSCGCNCSCCALSISAPLIRLAYPPVRLHVKLNYCCRSALNIAKIRRID